MYSDAENQRYRIICFISPATFSLLLLLLNLTSTFFFFLHLYPEHTIFNLHNNNAVCMTPRHSRLHQPAVGLLPQHYLIGEGVSLPRITQIPFVLGAQPATLMAAAPVRQRSGPGGPRTQLPPCYYEGYLEKRGPKEKVGPQTKCHVVSVHAVMSRGRRVCMCVYERGGLCTAHRLIPPLFPGSCQLPYCRGMGEARLSTGSGGDFSTV